MAGAGPLVQLPAAPIGRRPVRPERGLSIFLKNGPGLANDLVDVFDMALDEQCFQFNECASFSPFIARGKAVFEVEYQLAPSQFCAQANALHFSAMQKRKELDAWRATCW